ncbi:phosphonate C-P lyase system protein PhnG [Roseovarius tibetensis]|uniref:phosphonate C-P lyase system protein PhnG n=1 Tax=Roseovarius tibetensis TaxID=2685897 RepID=UPI003D7F72F7
MSDDAEINATATAERRARLSTLACAPAGRVATLWAAFGDAPDHEVLRAPEIGTVMVRGRAGGTGAPFNLGEVTVTRCAVRLAGGSVGHGYVQGRDKTHARTVALIDALAEAGEVARIEALILAPLRAEAEAAHATRAGKAATTKVDFFTMVRGEG